MPKRVFIVHGWDGSPEEGWFPWLKKELSARSFTAKVLAMPNPGEPVIKDWVSCLGNAVGRVDDLTYFVGHSIGCQAIMRYLAGINQEIHARGVVFVGGWVVLNELATLEEKRIAEPWLTTKIDFWKVRQHASRFSAIFSDNDKFVPLSNKDIFERELNSKIKIEHNKGHFSGSDGVLELPSALEEVIQMQFME